MATLTRLHYQRIDWRVYAKIFSRVGRAAKILRYNSDNGPEEIR